MRQDSYGDARRVPVGVSAIVLVIIVVIVLLVLAAILYTMTSGYLGSTGARPTSLGFATTGFFRNANVTDINFTITSTSGLITAGQVGFKLIPATGGLAIPVGIVSSNTRAGCTVGNPFGGCGAGNGTPGSWYLVITDSSANVRAVYDASGWIEGAALQLSASYTLTLVSATSYIGTDDALQVYGLGGSTVSGEVTL
jgi:hypothetical protein